MRMVSERLYHYVATFGALAIYWIPGDCQVYSWNNQPDDIYNQPCNSDQLNFTWTYTPASPEPPVIQWSRQNEAGTFDAIVRVISGAFTPTASYTGRVVRLGNTAELGLTNPTSADDGTYRVSVTDENGDTITSGNIVVTSINTTIVDASGLTAICGSDGKTITCGGVKFLGMPGANLTLSYGSFTMDNGGTQTSVSHEMTSRENVTCSLLGPATECLAADVMKSASIKCGLQPTTPSTSEPTTTTTTSTAMENNTAITTVTTETTTTTPPIQFPLYAIVIIVVAVLAIIIVIIIYFVRKYKNKEAKETYDEASRPQGVMDINLTNKETGANNQEEGSYTSSKFNTSQMTAADDPVQDNPLPGGRSEVRMGGRSEVRMLRM